MIISHAHRFIFFAVPRTGTWSIREALAPHLAQDDWRQHALHGRAKLPIPELAAHRHGHLSLRDVAAHLPTDVWKTYFKFAFVRNPFERFVSAYVFLLRATLSENHSPRDVTQGMKTALGRQRFRRRILIQPQCHFLEDSEGRLGIEYIGRYERLEADFAQICRQIGVSASLGQVNTSDHLHFSHYYDAELRSIVADLYSEDIRRFGYSFESGESM